MKVAGYIRISRGNYRDNIISLEAEMKEYISSNSEWSLVDIYYDEGASNKIKGRVGFKKMMDAVKENKVDVIVVRNINRLVGNAEITELITLLNEHNVKLYLTEYGDYVSERALTSLAAFMAMQREIDIREKELEREYEEIVENTVEAAENLYHHLYYHCNYRAQESIMVKEKEVLEISVGKYHAKLALTAETWRAITYALREIAQIEE